MSDENVELALQRYEAWNRGHLQWLLDHVAPDYEFRTAQLFPDMEAVYRGRDGLREFLEHVPGAVGEPRGRDRAHRGGRGGSGPRLVQVRGLGRDGVEVTLPYANLLTIKDGLLTLNIAFADWQRALEASGLRE